jgi:hypothetical protein
MLYLGVVTGELYSLSRESSGDDLWIAFQEEPIIFTILFVAYFAVLILAGSANTIAVHRRYRALWKLRSNPEQHPAPRHSRELGVPKADMLMAR